MCILSSAGTRSAMVHLQEQLKMSKPQMRSGTLNMSLRIAIPNWQKQLLYPTMANK
jgi:hypothetical protein